MANAALLTPPRSHRGFILTEALVALLIFCTVFLALEGVLTIATRRFADAARNDLAARSAESRREMEFAIACTSATVSDSSNTVIVTSSSTVSDYLLRVVQITKYRQLGNLRTEQYEAVSRCQ